MSHPKLRYFVREFYMNFYPPKIFSIVAISSEPPSVKCVEQIENQSNMSSLNAQLQNCFGERSGL